MRPGDLAHVRPWHGGREYIPIQHLPDVWDGSPAIAWAHITDVVLVLAVVNKWVMVLLPCAHFGWATEDEFSNLL